MLTSLPCKPTAVKTASKQLRWVSASFLQTLPLTFSLSLWSYNHSSASYAGQSAVMSVCLSQPSGSASWLLSSSLVEPCCLLCQADQHHFTPSSYFPLTQLYPLILRADLSMTKHLLPTLLCTYYLAQWTLGQWPWGGDVTAIKTINDKGSFDRSLVLE